MAVFCQYGSTSLNSYQSTSAISIADEKPKQASRSRHSSRGRDSNNPNPQQAAETCFLLGISPTLYSPFATSPRMTSQSAIASLYVTAATAPMRRESLSSQSARKPSSGPRGCLKSKISCSLEAHLGTRTRRVTFADSKGFTLTKVKYLFETPNEPPQSFIDGDSLYEAMKNLNLTGCPGFDNGRQSVGNHGRSVPPSNKFNLQFAQPFADYSGFRKKLERDFVALENCSVECSGVLSGTIKVRNIDFNKQVQVRITTDQWATYVDRACTHNAAASGGDPLFDTFEFNINDLARGNELECTSAHFCVRYAAAGCEYWDNNGGLNYTVNISHSDMQQRHQVSSCELKPAYRSLQNTPTTYIELPTPQHSSWAGADCTSPFY